MMTGGIGFSGQGKNAFRENRKLVNRRPLMKENPYVASKKAAGKRNPAATDEIQQWKDEKGKKEKLRRVLIFSFLSALIVVISLLAFLFTT